MSDDKFKLPISSYAELAKIVAAYGTFRDEAVNLDEVVAKTSIGKSTISGKRRLPSRDWCNSKAVRGRSRPLSVRHWVKRSSTKSKT